MRTPLGVFRDLPIARKLLLTSVIPLVALALLSVVTYRSVKTFSEDEEQLNSLYLVQRESAEYLRLALELQSGFRGYVLTDQEGFLRPYLDAKDRIVVLGDLIADTVRPREAQRRLFEETQGLVNQLITDKERLIESYRRGDRQQAIDYIEDGHGRDLLVSIRRNMSDLERLEQNQLSEALANLATDRTAMMSVILWGGLLAFGFLILALQMIARSIAEPLITLASAVGTRSAGLVPVVPVLPRGDEIGGLSRVMHAMSTQVRQHLAKVEQSESDLRRLNQHLLVSESKYRSIVDHAPFGIFATRGVTPIFSNGYNRLLAGLGDSADENADFWQAVHPQDREGVFGEFQQAVEQGEPFQRMFRFLHPDGTVRKVLSRAIPIRDAAGQVVMYQGFNVDITALDQMQAQLTRSERLATLGQVAAGIAHEIRNPLIGIGSTVALLLEDTPEGDPRRGDLAVILRETRRLDRIVNQIIDYARPRNVAPGLLSVETVIQESLSLLYEPLNKKRIKVDCRIHPGVSQIEADRDQLKQVLLNVMQNALEAMPDGGVLEISVFDATRERGPGVLISISDTGVGIPPADLPRIFEPFFTTGKRSGTGLGLAICRNIVELHHGDIEASSEPGHGTTFRIWLPLRPQMESVLL